MKRLILLIIFSFVFSVSTFSQQHVIDSLENQLKVVADSLKPELLCKLSELYRDISTDESIKYGERALQLIKDGKGNKKMLGKILRNLGEAYYLQWRFKRAIDYYNEELRLHRDNGENENVVKLLFKLGNAYNKWNRKRRAISYYERSLEMAKRLDLQFMVLQNYIELYTLYTSTNNNQLAADYYDLYVDLYSKQRIPRKDTIKIIDTVVSKETERITRYKTRYITEEVDGNSDKLKELDSALNVSKKETAELLEEMAAREVRIGGLLFRQMLVQDSLKMKQQEFEMKAREVEQKNRMILIMAIASFIMVTLIVIIFIQFNQKRKANERLRKSEANLKELNATKDKFFSIIAHDLKNPLHILLLTSDILAQNFESYSPEKIKVYILNMNKSSKSLANLLENLLNWSRAQLGTIEYKPKKLNLYDVVQEVLSPLWGNAEKKDVSISTNLDENLHVNADKNMIALVIRNLVSNAIKFTQHGGNIQLQANLNNSHVEIEVQDSGIGIPDEDIPKLFRIDVQHTTTGTDNEQGTGIGLILCKEFIEKHGGKIWAESEQGKGSKFKFTVPVC